MPLGVTIATPEVADAFQKLTISTFGGNPVSCAAALATLDVMEEEDIPRRSEEMGARLREGLEKLQRKYPRAIGEVRGKGLMLAVEMVKNEEAGDRTPDAEGVTRLFEETKARGLLIGKGGLYGNVLRITPPMLVEADAVDEALRILDESFAALANGNG
jgi:4-aminobutyrate aminotransferase-like enzyme